MKYAKIIIKKNTRFGTVFGLTLIFLITALVVAGTVYAIEPIGNVMIVYAWVMLGAIGLGMLGVCGAIVAGDKLKSEMKLPCSTKFRRVCSHTTSVIEVILLAAYGFIVTSIVWALSALVYVIYLSMVDEIKKAKEAEEKEKKDFEKSLNGGSHG